MKVLTSPLAKMVSPNPFSETTTFSFDNDAKYQLKIYDISGRQVDEGVYFGKEFTYRSTKIPHGVYYYEVKSCVAEESEEMSFARGILIKH